MCPDLDEHVEQVAQDDLRHGQQAGKRLRSEILQKPHRIRILLRKLKDGSGNYLWGGDLSKGQEQTLLGKPVIINNAMASMTTGQKPLLFGAFQYFGIADRAGITIKRLEELYAATGQVGFRAYKRFDSRVLLNSALKYLTMA